LARAVPNAIALKAFLDTQGIALMPQTQYFDKYRLDAMA
jgi:hypothetical protein